jgi:hypothetical protein
MMNELDRLRAQLDREIAETVTPLIEQLDREIAADPVLARIGPDALLELLGEPRKRRRWRPRPAALQLIVPTAADRLRALRLAAREKRLQARREWRSGSRRPAE